MLHAQMLSPLGNWLKRKTRHDIVLIAIVLIFFLGMLPLAATRVIDTMNFERYYTDAAISMLQSHDFFTPRSNDGSLRLHKPLPIYWILIGSFKLLGISFFSTRLPFLITACATIWLTYRLAFKMTGNQRTARTAALVLLSNVLFISVSARATQDILVTFCLLVSAYGFIQLICHRERHSLAYWCAYGGAALGVATKGLLPVVFVFYSLVFAYFASSNRESFRAALNPIVIVCSVLIASAVFLVMVWKHGPAILQNFFDDQLSEKIGFNRSPVRVSAYFLIYLVVFLPWVLCLAYLFYKRKPEQPVASAQREACVFILIWAALVAILFGLGDRVQDRYLVPAVPLLAVVIAAGLCQLSDSSIAAIANLLLNVLTAVFVAIAAFGMTLLWQTGLLAQHFAGLSVLILTLLLVALRSARRQLSCQAVLSLSIFLILPLCLALISPFTLPDQTTQVARALRGLDPDKKPISVIGTSKLTSRLRVATGGEYVIQQAKRADLATALTRSTESLFILTQGEATHFRNDTLQLRDIAAYPIRVRLPRLFLALIRGNAKSYIDSCKVHCFAVLIGSDSAAKSSRVGDDRCGRFCISARPSLR